MLLSLDKFKGTAPRVEDPALLPDGQAQQAIDCRFDLGGIAPFFQDNKVITPTNNFVILSIFRYYDPDDVPWFFAWGTDVDAIKTPLLGDAWDRVFYTEAGVLKVTDKNMFFEIASQLIASWANGSPGFDTLTSTASPNIASAVNTAGTTESAHTASITVTSGVTYQIIATLTLNTGQAPTLSFTNPTTSQALAAGKNTISFTASSSSTVLTMTNTAAANWSCTFTLYQVGTNYPESFLYPSPPAPTQAITASGSATGSDPTLLETRAWVYTYVNVYGEEGPPSPTSNLLDLYDGNTATLTGISASGISALYALANINTYRINESLTGAQYQFAGQIAIATTSFSDSTPDAYLGEILASLEWDGPPAGITGLIALPNGVCAAFVGNQLLLSAQNHPHAWPASYQKATERDIVALGNIGTTVVVLTKGPAYGVVVNDPSNTVMEKIDGALSCSSKRSKVQIEVLGIVAYASPEGIMTIGADGAKLATAELMTSKEWSDNYNPTTISAWYWQGKYLGFYTDSDGIAKGFIFDFGTKDFIDLDLYALAGFHDLTDGKLYLQVGVDIVSFSDTAELRAYDWLSKIYRFLPGTLKWIKAIGATYPVLVDMITRIRKKDGSEEPRTMRVSVPSNKPITTGYKGLMDNCEIRLTGNAQVSAMYLSSTQEELPL